MGNDAVREVRIKKFKALRKSLSQFIDLHLNDFSHLVHGENYSLTFDICFKDILLDDEADCISALRCKRKESLLPKPGNLLPELKKCCLNSNDRLKTLNKIEEQVGDVCKLTAESLKAANKQIEAVEMLTYTSNVSKNLMMDLLDLAQLDNNSFKINNQDYSLPEVIDEAFKVVGHIATSRRITLEPLILTE
jgi:signal transduction histidine kinase